MCQQMSDAPVRDAEATFACENCEREYACDDVNVTQDERWLCDECYYRCDECGISYSHPTTGGTRVDDWLTDLPNGARFCAECHAEWVAEAANGGYTLGAEAAGIVLEVWGDHDSDLADALDEIQSLLLAGFTSAPATDHGYAICNFMFERDSEMDESEAVNAEDAAWAVGQIAHNVRCGYTTGMGGIDERSFTFATEAADS